MNSQRLKKGNDTLVLDLIGKTVLLGFIDSHMHPVLTGMVACRGGSVCSAHY